MDAKILDQYAELIVSVGANVQPGRCSRSRRCPRLRRSSLRWRAPAYGRGARFVERAVLRRGAEAHPGGARAAGHARLGATVARPADRGLGELDAARVVLVPLVPPGLLDGVDPARAGQDRLPSLKETFKTIDDRSIAWTLSPFPTTSWAQVVYPDAAPDDALEQLWQDVIHVLPPRRARPGPRVDGAHRPDLAGGAAARRARPRRVALPRARARISRSACSRARASRRRAARRTRAPVSSTWRTSRPKRSTRRPIRSGRRGRDARRSRSTWRARSSPACASASRAGAP